MRTNKLAKYYALLMVACIFWAFSPICGRYLKDSMSPLLITSTRFYLVAAILFSFLYLAKGKKAILVPWRDLKILMIMGCVGIYLHNFLFFEALRSIPASNAALIESIGPAVTSTLAFIFIGEKLSKLGWLGIALCCIGAIFIVCKGSINALLSLRINLGEILVIICEAMWSIYVVISWKLSKNISPITVTAWTGLFGAIYCTITGVATDSLELYRLNTTDIIAFLTLSILAGVVAFVSWNVAITKVGASKGGTFVYLIPLFGVIFGITILKEKFVIQEAIGGLIIVLGLFCSMRAKLTNRKKSA